MREFATLSGGASTRLPNLATQRSGLMQHGSGRPILGAVRCRLAGAATCPNSLKTIQWWLMSPWNDRIMQEGTGRRRASLRPQSGCLGT